MQPIHAPRNRSPPTTTTTTTTTTSGTAGKKSAGFFPHGRTKSPSKIVQNQQQTNDNDDDDDDAPIDTSLAPAPAPRPLIFGGTPVGGGGAGAAAAAAAAAAVSGRCEPGMNLRLGKALSSKTNALHEKRKHTLAHSPVARVVFIQRIALFASPSIRRAAELTTVSSSWEESIKLYTDCVWPQVVRQSRPPKTQFDAVGNHSEDMDRFYQQQRGIPRPPPPSLSKEDVGTKTLFALCALHNGCDMAWLVYCLCRVVPEALSKTSSVLGWTPLMLAVSHRLADTTDVLLQCGADPTFSPRADLNRNRKKPEQIFRSYRYDGNATQCKSALTIAVSTGQNNILKLLLDTIAPRSEMHAQFIADCIASKKQNPMVDAVVRGGEDALLSLDLLFQVFPALIDVAGVSEEDVASRKHDSDRDTPLMAAARRGLHDVAEWLIEHKADIHRVHEAAGVCATELAPAGSPLRETLTTYERQSLMNQLDLIDPYNDKMS